MRLEPTQLLRPQTLKNILLKKLNALTFGADKIEVADIFLHVYSLSMKNFVKQINYLGMLGNFVLHFVDAGSNLGVYIFFQHFCKNILLKLI